VTTDNAEPSADGVHVSTVATSALGDHSHLVTDGTAAVVIDPQRDVDRMIAEAGRLGVPIVAVLETHVHNDYVSGGLELARLTGAEYGMAAADDVDFPRRPLRDGDVLEPSDHMRMRAVATPGHTFHHLSYVLEADGRPLGAFTGGSLLLGSTGRTDLLGPQHSRELARHQHASARKPAGLPPDDARIWPPPGFGSFCSAAPASGDAEDVGGQRRTNPALTLAEDAFVEQTLAGLDAYPAYYAHMGAHNVRGPRPLDLTAPRRATPGELARRLAQGEWVVDLRHRTAYAASHLAGIVSLGLDGPMVTWLGWLIDWGAPLTLVGESSDQVAAAQRELARIGIDAFAGAAVGTPAELTPDTARLSSTPTADFGALAAELRGETTGLPAADVLLDVRTNREFRAGHVAGALHIPLYALRDELDRIPPGTVWVHCGSGYRAAAAASLLEQAHRAAVVIDDSFDAAEQAGAPMATLQPAA
jgi:glyoxylase-like metal-dependent hydrolase (beta-lactamase superfamily II)/rhodanese-related sulfurtransferase